MTWMKPGTSQVKSESEEQVKLPKAAASSSERLVLSVVWLLRFDVPRGSEKCRCSW